MKRVMMYIWQLPQHLLALLLLAIFKPNRDAVIVHDVDGTLLFLLMNLHWGVSLGKYIILDLDCSENIMNHERGHTKQSKMLGPLYLVIVGLPSIIMNVASIIMSMFGSYELSDNYYKRWPESWADKLGGVKRSK